MKILKYVLIIVALAALAVICIACPENEQPGIVDSTIEGIINY